MLLRLLEVMFRQQPQREFDVAAEGRCVLASPRRSTLSEKRTCLVEIEAQTYRRQPPALLTQPLDNRRFDSVKYVLANLCIAVAHPLRTLTIAAQVESPTSNMADSQVTLRTRKFIRNPLLGRRQMVV